jgi:23S rRNA U2552 (ribose-2'-O)-methylase RlmE/FtsJ
MQQIAQEMHQMTGGALAIAKRATGDAAILDTCMAPGGFLNTAMKINPGASALGMSLPVDAGGHKVLAPKGLNVSCRFVDINMLAADIGVSSIPPDHPDAENFLPRQIDPAAMFDLAICDGQVLRPHTRAPYRERREAIRLTLAQLILSLEHLRPGGTMIVLLHRVERPKCLGLLYTFSKFSSVQLFKPKKYHATRSSFYMIVTDVQSQHLEAQSAVAAWKKQWNAATFGTDEEVEEAIRAEFFDVDKVLQDFGPELLRMGRAVWVTQAQALSKKSWTRKQTKNQDTGDRTMLE